TACRRAGSPTRTSPLLVNATTLGVSRLPSALGITLASLPSITATTELVVPRSMPMIFSPLAMRFPPFVLVPILWHRHHFSFSNSLQLKSHPRLKRGHYGQPAHMW